MRRTLLPLGIVLALAAPAVAQSNQGAFGLDATVAPATSLGFSYYVKDGLSVRPWLGLGYSDYSGFFANVGAELRYELRVDDRLSPYVSATALYSHYGNSGTTVVTTGSAAYQPITLAGDIGQFGAGCGLRFQLLHDLSLFAEGRAMYATSPMGAQGTGWSTIGINDRTHVDAVLGVTYFLH
jgi:hypothetical protein